MPRPAPRLPPGGALGTGVVALEVGGRRARWAGRWACEHGSRCAAGAVDVTQRRGYGMGDFPQAVSRPWIAAPILLAVCNFFPRRRASVLLLEGNGRGQAL
jgi:hypothetical protein